MTLRKLSPAPNRGTQLIYVAGGYLSYLVLSKQCFVLPRLTECTLTVRHIVGHDKHLGLFSFFIRSRCLFVSCIRSAPVHL